ncbi:hypothetical protein [Inquilinus sp. Marseille-Q2685]|uniref:hypothetical protein n=1 Tax=Inquilinus sp. Marseille-Q2685 TaxID=2866581 RepID=UPI001CE46AD4|nr:hypothetical protein [Inquilinus sp. Marseille-Q2685]
MALGSFRAHRRIVLAAALLALAACAKQGGGGTGTATETVKNQTPSGTVEMHQIQAAFIGSGDTGSGTLRFQGKSYPFNVSGLGVGGIGVSTVEATGEVYDLAKVDDFEGAYVQGRYGFAVGEESGGALWLKNDKGVVMRLKTKRTGLMLSLGGDAVVITLK